MSCYQYGWYSPNRWICDGAAAITQGLFGGTGDAVEKAVENAFTRATTSFQAKDFGADTGARINKELGHFWDTLDLTGNANRASGEFKEAFQAGIKNIGLAENIGLAGDEIGEGLGVFRKRFFNEIDGFRVDIQEIFSNSARDTTLKMIPWIASGVFMVAAAPLSALYIYNKAKHNIGRPKLAGEVRYSGRIDRALDTVSRFSSGAFQSITSGAKWLAATGLTGVAGFIPTAIACALTHRSCPIRDPDHYWQIVVVASALSGAIGATSKAGSLAFGTLKNWWTTPPAPKPIFSPEVEKEIAAITHSTYNLQKNGGFFQNLLLYGPGGTGKTMVAEKIARDSNLNYIKMSGGDLAQYIKRGEHVTELNKLFQSINNASTPTILFIDEIESLARDRAKIDKAELFELLNALLSQTGGSSKKFMIIGATNRPEDLDEAFLSRMDHKLEILPPQIEERKKILEQYVPHFFTQQEQTQFFSQSSIEKIAEATEGLTGRTLFKMLNALSCKKMASTDNTLTQEMINETVAHFVSQEKKIAATREPS